MYRLLPVLLFLFASAGLSSPSFADESWSPLVQVEVLSELEPIDPVRDPLFLAPLSVELRIAEGRGDNADYVRESRSVEVEFDVSNSLNATYSLCLAAAERELRYNQVKCSPIALWDSGTAASGRTWHRGGAMVPGHHWMAGGLMVIRAHAALRLIGSAPLSVESNSLRFDWRPTLPNLTVLGMQDVDYRPDSMERIRFVIGNDGARGVHWSQVEVALSFCTQSAFVEAGVSVDPDTFSCHPGSIGYAGGPRFRVQLGQLPAGYSRGIPVQLQDYFRRPGLYWMTVHIVVDPWDRLLEENESEADNTYRRTVSVRLRRD